MKSCEPFDWNRLPFILEAHGRSMDEFVSTHQDKSRNALIKAHEAGFLAWSEELKADQAQFMSEKLSMEKEGEKKRTKLVAQLEDCHNRAWQCVGSFLDTNLKIFAGRSTDSESTVLPNSRTWIRDITVDIGSSPQDHAVILILNLPAHGVVSASRQTFILNYVSNLLADYPMNGICFAVHPNRAGQENRRGGQWSSQDMSE
ncbi:Uncharacterized protein SCF082_LOCUS48858 [Durusdinium trenchii]|uniref:CRAL-TRIO domain-containing protein n=1 Tax=Durusdinium trenchii TaxID=1381693 RepID=A0ABP0RYH3_9DINO